MRSSTSPERFPILTPERRGCRSAAFFLPWRGAPEGQNRREPLTFASFPLRPGTDPSWRPMSGDGPLVARDQAIVRHQIGMECGKLLRQKPPNGVPPHFVIFAASREPLPIGAPQGWSKEGLVPNGTGSSDCSASDWHGVRQALCPALPQGHPFRPFLRDSASPRHLHAVHSVAALARADLSARNPPSLRNSCGRIGPAAEGDDGVRSAEMA